MAIKNVYVFTDDGEKVKIGEVNIASAATLTLDNPNSALVFTSLTGNLYTDQGLTTAVVTNQLYTQSTFYYDDASVVSGEYLYLSGPGNENVYYIQQWTSIPLLSSYMGTADSSSALALLPDVYTYQNLYESGTLSHFSSSVPAWASSIWTGSFS